MKCETQLFTQYAHCTIQVGHESSHCMVGMVHPHKELYPSDLFLAHALDVHQRPQWPV